MAHKFFSHTLKKKKKQLLKADSEKNHWPITWVIETFKNKCGVVQSVWLQLGNVGVEKPESVWLITKTVLLNENNSLEEYQRTGVEINV